MADRTSTNKKFYQQMVEGLDKPKILLVYFAREENEYPYLLKRDKENFEWANPGKKFAIDIAREEDFSKKAKAANVIVFGGGSSMKLIETVRKINLDLDELFEGKVISGSSAGAHMIAEWFYSHSEGKIRQGFGLLSVVVFTHYRPKKGTEFWKPDEQVKAIETMLKQENGKEEIIKLHEGEAIVFNK